MLRIPEAKSKRSNSVPHFVRFDLRDDMTPEEFRTMMDLCNSNFENIHKHHPRFSEIHDKFHWQRQPACQLLGENPKLVEAARQVMGLSPDAPIYFYGTDMKRKMAGDIHRLHSDGESDTPECRDHGSATVWVLVDRECPNDPSPLTLLSGSHKLHNANQELISRGCWSTSFKELPCNVTSILEEVAAANDNVEVVSGPR